MDNRFKVKIESLRAENQALKRELAEASAKVENLRSALDRKTHQLFTFFDITTKVLNADSLEEQLNLIAGGIIEARLFRRAIISVFSKEKKRIDVGYGGLSQDEIKKHRTGKSIPNELWQEIMSERFRVGNSYFIPHDDELNKRIGGIESSRKNSNSPDKWHPSDMLFVPLRGSDGKLLGVLSIDEPIGGEKPNANNLQLTELFAREAAGIIERSELTRKVAGMQQYLSKLIEASSDVIVSSDHAGRIVLFNSGAEKLFGYSSDEVVGKPTTLLYESEDEARRIMRMMREGTGKVQSMEVRARSKSGEIIPLSLSAALLYDENGNEIGTEGISKDLRPIKALQKRIMELRRKEAIQMVAVTLSHHINNYLQALIAADQNIEEILQSDDVKFEESKIQKSVEDYLGEIKLDALRIAHLTKALSNPPDKLAIDDYLDGIKMLQLPNNMTVTIENIDSKDRELQGKKHHLLVADDDTSVRDGIANFLRAHGFIVDTAKDGAEAIDLIERNSERYDAVISDIKMPFANGYEVFRAAKKANPSLPVILMTAFGYNPDHVLVRASREGLEAQLFKEKPFDMNSMLKLLHETIQHKDR